MTLERRHLLVLAGAMAAAAGLPRIVGASEPDVTETLEAQVVGEGPDAALSYRKPASAPVWRVTAGKPLHFKLKNGMSEPTGFDVQGLRNGASSGGGSDPGGPTIAPGAESMIAVEPMESGTLWFHPSFVPGRSNQTGLGLSGVLIVEEASPPAVDDDIVLLLTDRLHTKVGAVSDQLCVNGKAWPEAKIYVPGSRIRMRLVNGSTRLALTATFRGARPWVIAIDGQPSELFRPLDNALPIGPGARFDLIVDLPQDAEQDFELLLRGFDSAATPATVPALILRLDGAPKPDRTPVVALVPNPALPPVIPLEKAKRVAVVIDKRENAYLLNGVANVVLSSTPLFTAKRKTPISFGATNRTPDLIGIRPHGQAMRLLHALDDGWEPYWRDTVLVSPGKTVHVAFVSEQPGRWIIESCFFDQATAGLRHWFAIT